MGEGGGRGRKATKHCDTDLYEDIFDRWWMTWHGGCSQSGGEAQIWTYF